MLSLWAVQKQVAGPTGLAGMACTPRRRFRWVQDPRAGAAVLEPGAVVSAGDGAWLLVALPSCLVSRNPPSIPESEAEAALSCLRDGSTPEPWLQLASPAR